MQAHTGLCAYLEVALQLLANEFVVKDASSNRQTGPLGLLHHTLQINNISMSEQNIVNNSLSSVAPFIKLVQDFAELLHLKKKKKKGHCTNGVDGTNCYPIVWQSEVVNVFW